MPLWSPVDDRRASIGIFRKLLNMAFKPPDERSTRKLLDEAEADRPQSRGLMARLRRGLNRGDRPPT
jgi:hypothetical protein